MKLYLIEFIFINMEEKKTQKMKDVSEELISQLINNLLGYSQENGNLLQNFSQSFFLSYFDRFKIDEAHHKFPPYKQINIEQFTRILLNLIEHSPHETIYLAINIIDLYTKIKEESNNDKGIKFSDFTSFLCNKISQGDPDLIRATKQIPMEKMLPDIHRIRQIDLNPPVIFSKVQLQRPKITKNKNKKDKKLDEKKPVAEFIYSQSLNSVIALGRLSSSISLYDPADLKVQHKITPSACKIMSKDVAILSIAFCERNQRIGCIINNIGITFWEASDNFSTEKILGVNKSDYDPTLCGDKIYYLSLFNEWITTDKNSIYFWDLKEEKVTNSIVKKNAKSINDICQIIHLRSILVSYTLEQKHEEKQEKCLVLYNENKIISRQILGNPGCHSICYNPCTQLIVCLGYQSNIMVYQIDSTTFDIYVVRQLKGHCSILTCVSNIPNTSMILTGDDIGNIKVWQLNYMRCIQSIKLAKSLMQIQCNGKQLIFADSRLNTIQMDNTSIKGRTGEKTQIKSNQFQQNYCIYEFNRKDTESIWIITQKNAREINMRTGKTKNILLICNSDDEISACTQFSNGFIIGTSKGQIVKYSFSGELVWKINGHEGEIHCLRADTENKLIGSLGNDNNFIIWSQKQMKLEDNIRKKIVFNQKDVKLFEMCPFRNLVLIGSIDCKVSIWDYETIKLHYIVQFNNLVSAIKIIVDRPSILICTVDGLIHLYNFQRDGLKTRFYKKQTINIKLNLIDEIEDLSHNNRDIGKTELQLKMEASFHNLYVSNITVWEQQSLLFMTTNQGYVHCFIMNDYEPNPHYKKQYNASPNLKRPIKNIFENQLIKNQHQYLNETQIMLQEGILSELWKVKVHKQSIISVSILKMSNKYLCTLCSDGYYKILKATQDSAQIIGSIKIKHPLPIKWEVEISKMFDLRKKLHDTILILDSILRNSEQLSLKERKVFDISNFLQKMLIEKYESKKKEDKIKVMDEEYTLDDIQRNPIKQTTLKTLQAYKRLQLIKKQSKPELQLDNNIELGHYETPFLQKETIRNYLSPSYLPKLLTKGISQEYPSSVDETVNRLMDKLTKNKNVSKGKGKENRHLNLLKTSVKKFIKKEDKKMKKSEGSIEKEKVKVIINSINKKLNEFKKKPNYRED